MASPLNSPTSRSPSRRGTSSASDKESSQVAALKSELRRVSASNKQLEIRVAKYEASSAHLSPFGMASPSSKDTKAFANLSNGQTPRKTSQKAMPDIHVRKRTESSSSRASSTKSQLLESALPRSHAKTDLAAPSPMQRKVSSTSAHSNPSENELNRSLNSSQGASSRIPKYNIVGTNRALTATEHDVSKSPRPSMDSDEFDQDIEQDQDIDYESNSPMYSQHTPPMTPNSQFTEEGEMFVVPDLPFPQSTRGANKGMKSSTRRSSIPTPSSLTMTPNSSQHSNGNGNNRGGIFFGSSDQAAARHEKRLASATSGSGKVISDLQAQLTTRQAALDTTKSQLRNSQRAVDYLSRQNTDLTEGKDRLKAEYEGLSKIVARKERMLEEVLARARAAESGLEAHHKSVSDHKTRMKEMESSCFVMEQKMKKAESEYAALKSSVDSIIDGCRRDVQDVQKLLVEQAEKHSKELASSFEERAALQAALSKRQDLDKELKALLSKQEARQQSFTQLWQEQLSDFKSKLEAEAKANEEANKTATEVDLELKRMRKMMREYKE